MTVGTAYTGIVGGYERCQYACVGSQINLAARLESLNKSTGTQILVSGETLADCRDTFIARRLGRVGVVGRAEPIELFELLGLPGELSESELEELRSFEQAVDAYGARDFDQASRLLDRCVTLNDGPVTLYRSLIDDARRTASDEPWDGVVRFTKK